MVGKQILPVAGQADVCYGQATICYGRQCMPHVGADAHRVIAEGWRAPWGEITQDKRVAIEWAKDLDDYLLWHGRHGEKRAA